MSNESRTKRRWSVGAALTAGLMAAALTIQPAFARRGPGGGRGQSRRMGQGLRQQGMRGRMQGPGPGFMQRLRELPPEEQQRVLKNNKRFRQLPTEQQARIRENLERWNSLSPEQKQRLREREQIFQRLTPEQRREARALFQQWRDVPPARRRQLRMAFRRMRNLPPGRREQFLSSPEIQNRFSPDEVHMLRGLGRLLPEGQDSP